jgi:hypothetical protein
VPSMVASTQPNRCCACARCIEGRGVRAVLRRRCIRDSFHLGRLNAPLSPC